MDGRLTEVLAEPAVAPERGERREKLEEIARQVRVDLLRMIHAAGSGHPGGSLSVTDLLVWLLFEEMRYLPADPTWEKRDRLVLSKGHACPALYATLAAAGVVDPAQLMTLRRPDSPFQGHPDRRLLPILEVSSGSLGQGLSVGIGLALASRLTGRGYRTFVILGDGELNEGQVWEAAMLAGAWRTSGLVCIVDANRQQLDDWTAKILDLEPLEEKWAAFKWAVRRFDGHDFGEIERAFAWARAVEGPAVLVADTIKGKGVSFMENALKFHGMAPTDEELARALAELQAPAAAGRNGA